MPPQITINEPLAPGVYTLTPFVAPTPVPVPVPDPIPTPPARWPVGKGFYIWNLKNCGGGNPAKIVDLALQAGVDWVTIKLHDGPNPHANVARLNPVLTALRSANIDVWGWGYNYAIQPANEARKAVELTRQFGLSGYMIDVEAEYKDAPGQNIKRIAAKTFCDAFRAADATLPVGLASYRYPSLHSNLAWEHFCAIIDFHNPQVYWMGTSLATSPTFQLAKSVAQLRALKDVPVIPIGVSSPDDLGVWRPTVEQLDNFAAGVKAQGLPGYCWWSWEHAERVPAWWNAIARHP